MWSCDKCERGGITDISHQTYKRSYVKGVEASWREKRWRFYISNSLGSAYYGTSFEVETQADYDITVTS